MESNEETIERDYSKRASFRLLARLIAPYKGLAAAALLFLLCDITGMLFVPTELAALLNSVTTGAGTDAIWRHGVLMLAASLVGSLGCIVSYWFAARLAANVGRDLRTIVYDHSLKLSAADFNRFGAGSMVTRALSDANVVQQTLLMCFTMMGPVPVTSVVAIMLAFGIDPAMGWVLFVVVVICLTISLVAVAKSAPIFLVMQGFVDRMNVRLREVITGIRPIRAFGKDADERARLDETFDAYASRAIRVNLVFAVTDSMTFFLMNAVESLIFWFGMDRVGAHAMQIASISAVLEYALLILFFVMMAQMVVLTLPRAAACLNRAQQVLEIKPSIVDGQRTLDAAASDSKDGADAVAVFDHMSFRFDDADEDTLCDLSFACRRGQTTAIVGSTGSGKSTVAKLLLRFHDATKGVIRLDGVDLRELSQGEIRGRIAYVPQKAWLFSGTVASNLRFGNEDATEADMLHALQVAQSTFVLDQPQGLDTPVAQGGTNFSGGQRQRLAIARALMKRADLYIFDDSFSALDFKTDAALRHALQDETRDAAVLIIAQRISTILHADQIVVLKDGEVVGLGTHEELMETCEVYRAIAESQMKGGE